jgi:hypothetical protein
MAGRRQDAAEEPPDASGWLNLPGPAREHPVVPGLPRRGDALEVGVGEDALRLGFAWVRYEQAGAEHRPVGAPQVRPENNRVTIR